MSLIFLGSNILIQAILDGLTGAKLNSNEQVMFATEWDAYSGNYNFSLNIVI